MDIMASWSRAWWWTTLRSQSWAVGLALAWLGVAQAQPVIEVQPTGASVYESQTVTLNVVASGVAPLSYQWRMMGTNLPLQGLPSLTLTNVALGSSAVYDVVVTNLSGAVTSAPVLVVVLSRPVPLVSFGGYTVGAAPSIPVIYTAFGGETNVSFSVAYDSKSVTAPRFESALTNLAGTVEVTPGAGGLLGVRARLEGGAVMSPGATTLGTLVFEPVAGAGIYAAGLGLTNTPVALACGPIGGTNFTPGILPAEPVVRVVDSSEKPRLDSTISMTGPWRPRCGHGGKSRRLKIPGMPALPVSGDALRALQLPPPPRKGGRPRSVGKGGGSRDFVAARPAWRDQSSGTPAGPDPEAEAGHRLAPQTSRFRALPAQLISGQIETPSMMDRAMAPAESPRGPDRAV